SLGYPDTELRATGEQRAELKYLNGSDCPNEKGKKLSAIIEFKCDVRAGRGNAALDKSGTQKCEYRFVWKTNVICPSQNCDFKADSCEIFNKPLNISY
uniref:MRH domain-containing protein n=1 Tax=Megaselia scalaris TaxID=36166 RepID=T1GTW1_MEGSC